MFFPLLASQSHLFQGIVTHGYYVGGGTQAHGYGSGSMAAIPGLPYVIGDAQPLGTGLVGPAATDGSKYELAGLIVLYDAGVYYTYITMYRPVADGGAVSTQSDLWKTLYINGATLNAASANGFYYHPAAPNSEFAYWYFAGDPLSLYALAAGTALPFHFTKA